MLQCWMLTSKAKVQENLRGLLQDLVDNEPLGLRKRARRHEGDKVTNGGLALVVLARVADGPLDALAVQRVHSDVLDGDDGRFVSRRGDDASLELLEMRTWRWSRVSEE
jgi:hypothetical protein